MSKNRKKFYNKKNSSSKNPYVKPSTVDLTKFDDTTSQFQFNDNGQSVKHTNSNDLHNTSEIIPHASKINKMQIDSILNPANTGEMSTDGSFYNMVNNQANKEKTEEQNSTSNIMIPYSIELNSQNKFRSASSNNSGSKRKFFDQHPVIPNKKVKVTTSTKVKNSASTELKNIGNDKSKTPLDKIQEANTNNSNNQGNLDLAEQIKKLMQDLNTRSKKIIKSTKQLSANNKSSIKHDKKLINEDKAEFSNLQANANEAKNSAEIIVKLYSELTWLQNYSQLNNLNSSIENNSNVDLTGEPSSSIFNQDANNPH